MQYNVSTEKHTILFIFIIDIYLLQRQAGTVCSHYQTTCNIKSKITVTYIIIHTCMFTFNSSDFNC